MINRFSQYLVEEERVGYFVFGRMNPPTIGHGKLLDKLAALAGRAPYRIYLSQSNDAKKNPLTYSDKVKFARKMFPRHARSIIIDKNIKTFLFAASKMYDDGFKKVIMVAGSDRVREFDILLNKYNGQKGAHGFYNFESIKVVSAGARDPDADGAEGASATKQRNAAKDNDFTAFAQGLTKAISNPDSRKLFNAVRKGMGLKEEHEFKRHVKLESVSETREAFVKGELFELGEQVVIKSTSEVGKITVIGSNYVIVETSDKTTRQWLDSVEKLDERYDIGTDEYKKHAYKMTPGQTEERTPQDSDIKDRKGSQPKAYHAGLKKATKVARDRHFKKHGKKADNDPSAYEPAPGDKKNKGKTKTSVWTKKFKNMYGD